MEPSVSGIAAAAAPYPKTTAGLILNVSKSFIISDADWYLLVGSFCIALKIISSIPIGISGFIEEGFLKTSCICISATATGVSASKGFSPVSISNNIAPTEYISLFSSVKSPRACSGLI